MGWVLRDQIATWSTNEWTVSVDLNSDPRLSIARSGLSRFSALINPQDADEPVGNANLELEEAYIRQQDLVTRYQEKAPLAFGYEAYFSWVDVAPNCVCLELWLSVQTSTLEAYPQLILDLSSELPPFEPTGLNGVYLSENQLAAWLVHPLDCRDVQLQRKTTEPQKLIAFGGFMEKGVIRRLRARLIVSAEPLSYSQLEELQRQFAESPLPLNT